MAEPQKAETEKSDEAKKSKAPKGKTSSSSKSSPPTPDSNELILKALADIKSAQSKSDSKMDALVKRVDEFENVMNSYENYENYDMYDGESHSCSVSSERPDLSDGEISEGRPAPNDRFSGLSKRFRATESCGPDINDTLASNINDLFKKGMDESQYEAMVKDDNIPRPANCEGLHTVKMNRPIWDIMSRRAQSNDAKLQKCATSVIKSSVILANTVNKLVEVEKALKSDGNAHSGEITSFIDHLNDAVALLGHANYQNCMVRRDLLKPELKKEFSVLYNHHVPYTGWLFGDDVSRTVKEIEDSTRMGSKVLWSQKRQNNFPLRDRFRGAYRHKPYYRSHNPSATMTSSDERKNSHRRGGAKFTRH